MRNHGGIPIIDKTVFKLMIGGLVNKPQILTLTDLQDPNKFEPIELTVTLQVCKFSSALESFRDEPYRKRQHKR